VSTSDEIKADLEQTREELAETVEAIAAKLDVKEQAKQHRGTLGRAAAVAAGALGAAVLVRRLATTRGS
jgi:hypothetical protein